MPHRFVVVGRGRMGRAFSTALRAARVPVAALSGRALTGGATRTQRPAGAVLWVLAVTDAAVSVTAAAMVARGWIRPGDCAVHLAGMLGPAALDALRARGVPVGALHPLVAAANPRRPPALAGATASFEGDRRALAAARALGVAIGLRIVPLAAVNRARYHAAAALVATGAVALAQGAAALFAGSATPPPGDSAVRAMLQSLLASVAHNVAVAGPTGALASPLLRGDTTALARHVDAMHALPDAQGLYTAALRQVLSSTGSSGIEAPVRQRAQSLLRRKPRRGR